MAFFLGGCSSTPAPGESSWSPARGVLIAVEEGDLLTVTNATVAAMKELGLSPARRRSDAFSTLVVGEVLMGALSQRTEVRVDLARLSEATTEIKMRILFRRDRQKLDQVLEGIRKHLRQTRKEPEPEEGRESS